LKGVDNASIFWLLRDHVNVVEQPSINEGATRYALSSAFISVWDRRLLKAAYKDSRIEACANKCM
jgi:hypothetical protein